MAGPILILWLIALPAMAAEPGPGTALPPGDHSLSLHYGGRLRTYLLHVPPATRKERLPVVLNFHGGGGNAAGQKSYTRMDETATAWMIPARFTTAAWARPFP